MFKRCFSNIGWFISVDDSCQGVLIEKVAVMEGANIQKKYLVMGNQKI